MKEIELLLPFGILLNVFQFYQIILFFVFSVCNHEKFTIQNFLKVYSIISILELGIMIYILLIVHREKEIKTEKEENIILSTLGIYLLIKFFLILCESFIEKTIHPFSKTKIYFHFWKLIKTFLTMNSFITVLLEKLQISERRKKIGFMIGFPLLLYGIFLGTNQLILFLRRRNKKDYKLVENDLIQRNSLIDKYPIKKKSL